MEVVCSKFDFTKELKVQRDLFVDCFPENLGTKVIEDCHYLWKFQSFPYTTKSYECIARIGEDMVGYYAAIPYKYHIAGHDYHVGMACDVMTSSKYRGKGIFTKLGRYSLDSMKAENVPFTIGYPIRQEVMPGHLKVGWKVAFKQPLYMKFLNTSSLLKSRNKGYLACIANPIVSLYNFACKKSNDKSITIRVFNKIEDVKGYQFLVDEWSKSITNTLDKSLDFAQWRYGAPEKEYIFIGAYEGEKLVGFSSLRAIVKEGVPSLGMLDFMILPGFKKCLANIHNEIVTIAKRTNKEAIMTMMSPTSAKNYSMLANGYFKSPFVFSVIMNKLDDSIDEQLLFNEENWHLMFIDSDDL